jgi:flagellar protein FliL
MAMFSFLGRLFRKKPQEPVLAEGEVAEASAGEAEAPAPQLFPALIPWLIVMGGMSVVAIGAGIVVGTIMMSTARRDANNAIAAAQQSFTSSSLIDLPPIVTNLADPANAWVRLQTSIVVDKSSPTKPDVLAAEIADDILGFMKTVTLAEIGGASGLQHLREDLTERAVIRSQGHVHELILQTLVVQ